MGSLTLVRSHVERCLQDIWEVCRVEVDDDGDYPFRHGTAACFVRVEAGEPCMVSVYGQAAVGVPRTAAVLRELNEVSLRARGPSVHWSAGLVLVRHVLPGATLDRPTLADVCRRVGTIADDIGVMIASVHGGTTPFAPEPEPDAAE